MTLAESIYSLADARLTAHKSLGGIWIHEVSHFNLEAP
jgi:hypothetical protein